MGRREEWEENVEAVLDDMRCLLLGLVEVAKIVQHFHPRDFEWLGNEVNGNAERLSKSAYRLLDEKGMQGDEQAKADVPAL